MRQPVFFIKIVISLYSIFKDKLSEVLWWKVITFYFGSIAEKSSICMGINMKNIIIDIIIKLMYIIFKILL